MNGLFFLEYSSGQFSVCRVKLLFVPKRLYPLRRISILRQHQHQHKPKQTQEEFYGYNFDGLVVSDAGWLRIFEIIGL